MSSWPQSPPTVGHCLAQQSSSLHQSGMFSALQLAGSHGPGWLDLLFIPDQSYSLKLSVSSVALLTGRDWSNALDSKSTWAKRLISTVLSDRCLPVCLSVCPYVCVQIICRINCHITLWLSATSVWVLHLRDEWGVPPHLFNSHSSFCHPQTWHLKFR